MTLDQWIVLVSGAGLIAFIFWFFFGKKRRDVVAHGTIVISVAGGYNPDSIVVPVGQTTTLEFLRTDQNSCLADVVLSEFNIKRSLPLGEKVAISITPRKAGEYPFTCGMGMYHGRIVAK